MKPAGAIFTAPRSSDGDQGKPGPRWRPPRRMVSRRKKLSDAELGRQIRAGDMGTLVAVTRHAGSSTNGVFYTQHNHRGDISLTRAGTATVGRCDFDGFGNPKHESGPDVCRLKFSSKEREPVCGLDYWEYRFYAPRWQRWIGRDPLGSGEGPNLYLYCRNQPVSNIDPTGRSIIGIAVIAGLLKEGGCFSVAAYIAMNVQFPNDSHEHKKHCLVGCLQTQMCGPGASADVFAQLAKELIWNIKDHGWPWNWDWRESWKDTIAELKGHLRGMAPGCDCYKKCNSSDLDS